MKYIVVMFGDYEKILAIIYTLFGDEGLQDKDNHIELFNLGTKYLLREEKIRDEEPDMDYKQDWGAIKSSFMSDYHININEEKMHYYDFIDLLSGLTENAMLSRIRYIRNYDISEETGKARQEWLKLKESVELNKIKPTTEQEQSAKRFMESLKV